MCDSCLTAAYDEGADDPDVQEALCEAGTLPDHECDHVDEPEIACKCACH